MRKMGKTTEMGSKVFHLNIKDIELIVRLLHEESDNHVYPMRQNHKGYFKARYDHIQDLIMELTK